MKTAFLAALICGSTALVFAADGGPMKIKDAVSGAATYADKTICVLGTTVKVEGSDNAALFKLQDGADNAAAPSLWLLVNGSSGTYKTGEMVAACGPFKTSAIVNNTTYAPLLTALSHGKYTPPKKSRPVKK